MIAPPPNNGHRQRVNTASSSEVLLKSNSYFARPPRFASNNNGNGTYSRNRGKRRKSDSSAQPASSSEASLSGNAPSAARENHVHAAADGMTISTVSSSTNDSSASQPITNNTSSVGHHHHQSVNKYGRDESLEDGEIRDDSTFDRSSTAMTVESAAAAAAESSINEDSAIVEMVKKLEPLSDSLKYSREFMVAAEKLRCSKKKPHFNTAGWAQENIAAVFNLDRQSAQGMQPKAEMFKPARQMIPVQMHPPMYGTPSFAPSWFAHPQMVDMAGRKAYPGRKSATGGAGAPERGCGSGAGGGTGRYAKPPPLIIARPVAEVELKSSKNAWKPSHKAAANEDPGEAETKSLLKEVRGILNKITPQMFKELAEEFVNLETRMNSVERATGVVDIVFQKAIDEPAFCSMYSELYMKMAVRQQVKQQEYQERQQQQPQQSETAEEKEHKKKTSFRWILLTKCQSEFERDKRCETSRQERLEAILAAETAEQKKQLQTELDEFMMKEKRRTLGNMRFIGELFLRNMLTKKIVHLCVMSLIKKCEDEESLECLCKLLTTIGKKLDADDTKEHEFQGQTDGYYNRLNELSKGLSSRVRFMILDLLELRANSWQPRRKGDGPKTLQQVHEDAAKEKLEKQEALLKEERERKKKHEQPSRQYHHQQQQHGHDARGGYPKSTAGH